MSMIAAGAAETLKIPNLRKLFIPDPGHIICDVDLDRADAVVVAWDANATKLKEIFKEHYKLVMAGKPGIDVHQLNADAIGCSRKQAKAGVHATNYGVSARTLAHVLGVSVGEAQDFIDAWFHEHPEIPRWHHRVGTQLATNRTVRNAFGFKAQFFGRPEESLNEALGWIPQSTVAITINSAWRRLREEMSEEVEVLLQVHDSLVFQYAKELDPGIRPRIRDKFLVTIPYEDPCVIPVGLKTSTKSWGDVQDTPWEVAA